MLTKAEDVVVFFSSELSATNVCLVIYPFETNNLRNTEMHHGFFNICIQRIYNTFGLCNTSNKRNKIEHSIVHVLTTFGKIFLDKLDGLSHVEIVGNVELDNMNPPRRILQQFLGAFPLWCQTSGKYLEAKLVESSG